MMNAFLLTIAIAVSFFLAQSSTTRTEEEIAPMSHEQIMYTAGLLRKGYLCSFTLSVTSTTTARNETATVKVRWPDTFQKDEDVFKIIGQKEHSWKVKSSFSQMCKNLVGLYTITLITEKDGEQKHQMQIRDNSTVTRDESFFVTFTVSDEQGTGISHWDFDQIHMLD